MRTAITLLFCLSSGAAMAADQCIRELPEHRSGHWHYRVINGQRCWEGPDDHRAERRQARLRALPAAIDRTAPSVREAQQAGAKTPTPIQSVAEAIEEERDEPFDKNNIAPRRIKVIPFTIPPSPSRMIQRYFDELVDQCQVSTAACEAFLR